MAATSGDQEIIPLPFELWSEGAKHWILALYIAFSVAWALEIVSHLEGMFLCTTTNIRFPLTISDAYTVTIRRKILSRGSRDTLELNFWLFLMSPNAPRSWFRSTYFVTWAFGSILAIAGLPITAIVTRGDPLKVDFVPLSLMCFV